MVEFIIMSSTKAVTYKLLTAAGIFVESYCSAHLPFWIKKFKTNKSLVSWANCLAGGIFLCAGLIHILPDAMELWAKSQGEESSKSFPVVPGVMLCSFAFILFIDRVLLPGHHGGHGHDGEDHAHHHHNHHSGHGHEHKPVHEHAGQCDDKHDDGKGCHGHAHGHGHCHLEHKDCPEHDKELTPEKDQRDKENSGKKDHGHEHGHNHEHHGHDQNECPGGLLQENALEDAEERRMVNKIPSSQPKSKTPASEPQVPASQFEFALETAAINAKSTAELRQETRSTKTEAQTAPLPAGAALARPAGPAGSVGSATGALAVVVAVGVHAVFEGIALGILAQFSDFLGFLAAIAFHKWAEALAVGIAFSKSGLSVWKRIGFIVLFSLLTPVGVVIGILASEADGKIQSIFLAVSGGTFLYIAVCEIISEELVGKKGVFVKFVFFLLGVGIMMLAWYFETLTES